MRQILEIKIDINIMKKSYFILGLFLFISINNISFANDVGLEERLYSKMTKHNIERATENLLVALESIPDGKKHVWKHGSYKGYIIPVTTFINEEGYFCRNYVEVLIRVTEYNMYENMACRDHDSQWVWIETTSANETIGAKKKNKYSIFQ